MTCPHTVHVLVGTSPADAARAPQLRRRADRLGADLAFLQLAEPSLGTVLDRCTAAGVGRVVLVGVGSGLGGPGVSWLRRIAAAWWSARTSSPGPVPEVATAPSFLGEDTEWEALVARASPIRDGGPGLTSPTWEEVPGHRRQVLACRGPRCTAEGAEETLRALVLGLMAEGLGDDDVLVTHTGCQFPCNQAPVVTVHPDDVWYGRVDAAAATEIVASHLVADLPVEQFRLRRSVRRD